MWASNLSTFPELLSSIVTASTAGEISDHDSSSNYSSDSNGVTTTTMKNLASQQLLPSSYDGYEKYCENLQEIGEMYNNIHGIASIAVCAFGIVANILNFLILTRKEMVNSTNAILTGLAVSDLLKLVEYVPYAIYMAFLPDVVDGGPRMTYPWAVYVLIHSNFSQVCHTISIWLTVTIAAWRYFMISTPLQSRVLCSMQRAKLMIAMAYCITPILCLPIYFTFSVQAIKVNRTNPIFSIQSLYSQDFSNFYNYTTSFGSTLPSVFVSSFILNSTTTEGISVKYRVHLSNLSIRHPNLVTINFWIYSVVLKIIPCILLTVVSVCLINSLLKAKKRKEMLLRPTPSSVVAAAAASSSSSKSRKLPTSNCYPFSHIPASAAPASTTTITSSPPAIFTIADDGDSSHGISIKGNNTCKVLETAAANEIPLQELGVCTSTQEQHAIMSSSSPPYIKNSSASSSTTASHSLAVQVTPDIESEQTSVSQYGITSSSGANRISSSSVSTGDIYLTSRTTRMLLTVLILFLITEFPQGILALFSAINGQEYFKRCYIPMANLMDFLALINCSINFILYCFMSRRFRDAFVRMLRRRKQ